MYLIFVLIVYAHLEEVFSSRALSLRRGFRAREWGKFGAISWDLWCIFELLELICWFLPGFQFYIYLDFFSRASIL